MFLVISCRKPAEIEILDAKVAQKNVVPSSSKELTFLFFGDIMKHELQIKSTFCKEKLVYDFSSQFEKMKPVFDTFDIVIGNLEVTFSGEPYSGYPDFSSPVELAVAIKESGNDYLCFANNHSFDFGYYGMYRTLRVLDSLNFVPTGVYFDAEDKAKNHPMVINKNELRVAVFNYTYGINEEHGRIENVEFSNRIDKGLILNDLINSKSVSCDAIIVYMHWGEEYERYQSEEQTDIANFCIEKRADIVIGSHPHVIQPMFFYNYKMKSGDSKEVLVAYLLGNFVSNYGNWQYFDGGAMLSFKLSKKDSETLKIIAPEYHLVWVYRPVVVDGLRRYSVLPVKDFEDDNTIAGEHRWLLNCFINDSREHLKSNNVNVFEAKK